MTQLSQKPRQPDYLSKPLLVAASMDWEKIIYILFILLAIVTRFFDLGSRVMSHDESLHTQFSFQFYDGQGFSHTPLMHGPFLFHITAVSYWLFGADDLSARIPIALLGVIIVAIPYFFRDWIGKTGALFMSFIFLISPYMTYYARYIRHDTPSILWGLIIFLAIIFYTRQRKEVYLWWMAAGLALLFATKEVSFIYVAIFGSFLVIRIAALIYSSDWIQDKLPNLRTSFGVMALAFLLMGAGAALYVFGGADEAITTEVGENQPFAADPEETAVTSEETLTPIETAGRWVILGGIALLVGGLVLSASVVREHVEQYAEYDLIMLMATILLPTMSPLFVTIAGWDPQQYTFNTCELNITGSSIELFFYRIRFAECWQAFFTSGMVRIAIFVGICMIAGALIGLWWNQRRWLIFAAIFHTIFFIFYTSVFTNMAGWTSGMVGSLGYWLAQQEVQRGSQPDYYYLLVVPFYEFLAVIFSLLAIRYWTKKHHINQILGYWLTLILGALLAYSLSDWFFNRFNASNGVEPNEIVGLIIGLFVFLAGVLYWFVIRRNQLYNQLAEMSGEERPLMHYFTQESTLSFIPYVTWWLIMTWGMYSYAGEKMPWLSTHFVIPMAILVGWYMNEKVKDAGGISQLLTRTSLYLLGLTILFIFSAALGLGPLFLGTIQFGDQTLANLNSMGRFLGGLIVAGGVFYLWWKLREQTSPALARTTGILGVFVVLSLLTVRFMYMANFVNADYVTEYMVYAHGAPAAKEVVMEQIDELSLRLNGDKTMQVAFGGSGVAWPFTWYLRDYPNRTYFAENPTTSLTETPVVIVGRTQMDAVDRLLSNTHEYRTYTYLWWPMEEYRNISWNSVFGNPNVAPEQRRGFLTDAAVRQSLWDIFFYRDYQQFAQTFGGSYTPGNWPLRDDLRMYIRRDVLANLWDYGVGAVNATGLEDPYAQGELFPFPEVVLNEFGVASAELGGLTAPRNMAIGPNGRIFVADSGNHRIQVFEADGTAVTTFGEFGAEAGQFNEPWGLAVDASHVYVADTWNFRIQKFTLDGEFVAVFGAGGSQADNPENNGLGLFFGPRDIHLYGLNELLVTDTGNHRFQILSRDGEFIREVGGQGSGFNQMNEPVGFTYGLNGDVYLVDTWNGRIQQFNNQLQAYNEWQVNAWSGNSINNKPFIASDTNGRLYVTDPEGARILIFDSVGNYLGRFGKFGTDIESFSLINGIFIDRDNNLYVADAGNNRILKFPPIFPEIGGNIPAPAEDDLDADESADELMEDPDEEMDEETMDEESMEEESLNDEESMEEEVSEDEPDVLDEEEEAIEDEDK